MTDAKKNFLILGLDETASPEEAKAAYRKKVKENHPDRIVDDPARKQLAEEKMKAINVAYKSVMAAISEKEKQAKKSAAQTKTQSPPFTEKAKPSPPPPGKKAQRKTSQRRQTVKNPRRPQSVKRKKPNFEDVFSEWVQQFINTVDTISKNFSTFFPKKSPQKSTRKEKDKTTSEKSFNEIFAETLKKSPTGRKSRPKGRGMGSSFKGYDRFARRTRSGKREQGPVGGIRPISKIKKTSRDQ